MVELDIRNQASHNELKSYNDNHTFLFIHGLTRERKYNNDQLTDLTEMKANSPESFLNEVTNVIQNIRRIESQIRTKKYKSDAELASWELNLTRAKIKHEIIKLLLK